MVSIIIPIYNHFVGLCEEILSSPIEKEILLINDGSEDRSAEYCLELAKKHRFIRFLDKKHSGVSDTRNYGIQNAQGEYLLFLDSDDELAKNSLVNLVAFFDACPPSVDLVTYPIETLYCGTMLPPHFRYQYLPYSGVYDLKLHPYIGQTTMNIMVRNTGENTVLFDTTMDMLEDQKYCCDILSRTLQMGFCADATYLYHRSEESTSGRKAGACYVFEQSMALFEELFARYPKSVPLAFQGLYVNDLAWKLCCHMLYPYHYKDLDFTRAIARIRKLLDRVEESVIWEHPNIDWYHKCYWISQKNTHQTLSFITEKCFGLQYDKKCILEEETVSLVIAKIRQNGDSLTIRGYLKAGILNFLAKPILHNGEEQIPLFPSAFGFHKARTRTNQFWAFCYEVSYREFTRFSCRVTMGFHSYPCRLEFLPKAPFSLGNCDAVVGDFTLHCEENILTKSSYDANKIHRAISRNPLIPWHIARMRNKAVALQSRKTIHLYLDCRGVRRDNGFEQFILDLHNHDGIDRYYVTSKEFLDCDFLKQYRKHILLFGSKQHKLLTLAAKKIFTSFIEDNNILPFSPEEYPYLSDFFGFTVEYLQHGILHANVPWKYNPECCMADFVHISTSYEERLFCEKYHFTSDQLIRSSMPRFARLNRDSIPQKKFLFAPSWREYLVGYPINGIWQSRERNFLASDYYKNILQFLQSPTLSQYLAEHGYVLELRLHPIFQQYKKHFCCVENPYISISNTVDSLDHYELLITDISSICFDFFYLGRRVFQFLPDFEQFGSGMNTYWKIEPDSKESMIQVRDAEHFCDLLDRNTFVPCKIDFI